MDMRCTCPFSFFNDLVAMDWQHAYPLIGSIFPKKFGQDLDK